MPSDSAPDAELIAYDDGDTVVLWEPETPTAWIRSDTVITADEIERDAPVLGKR